MLTANGNRSLPLYQRMHCPYAVQDASAARIEYINVTGMPLISVSSAIAPTIRKAIDFNRNFEILRPSLILAH